MNAHYKVLRTFIDRWKQDDQIATFLHNRVIEVVIIDGSQHCDYVPQFRSVIANVSTKHGTMINTGRLRRIQVKCMTRATFSGSDSKHTQYEMH